MEMSAQSSYAYNVREVSCVGLLANPWLRAQVAADLWTADSRW